MKLIGNSVGEVFDEKWFSRVDKINARLPTRLKPANYHEAKRLFLNDNLTEPKFLFLKLEDKLHTQQVSQLQDILAEIQKCPSTNAVVKKIYADKLNEKLKQYEILAVVRKNQAGENANELATLVESVYGVPSKPVFNHLVTVLKERLAVVSEDIKASNEFKELETLLSIKVETNVPAFTRIEPQELGDKIYTDAHEVRQSILDVLPSLNLQNWRVQISCDKTGGFKVWPRTKRIIVPTSGMLEARKGDRVLTETKLKSMIAHEVMTHALRVENGFKSPLKLLSTGLAGYWRGEEGIAGYREQQITGAVDYINCNAHFAIGIAYGLDRSGEKRNFREVFEIMQNYFFVLGGYDKESATEKSFATCERIFMAATGRGTSFVMTKDIAYREGNIAIYELLTKRPSAIEWFDVGKFDPTNQEHVDALLKLGIISLDR